ncbi:MAG TPA: hypothetical protein VF867_13290 [Arthrobacter sp.]
MKQVPYVSAMIAELMTGPVLETVALAVRDMDQTGILPGGFNFDELTSVHSMEQWFGSTAGPFPGIGGAAMTRFRLTILYSKDFMVLFADDRLYGVAPFDADAMLNGSVDHFAYTPDARVRQARIR